MGARKWLHHDFPGCGPPVATVDAAALPLRFDDPGRSGVVFHVHYSIVHVHPGVQALSVPPARQVSWAPSLQNLKIVGRIQDERW